MTEEERLRWHEAQAEDAHGKMYDAMNGTQAARYSDAKEALYAAIGIAERLGLPATRIRLEARLDHIKIGVQVAIFLTATRRLARIAAFVVRRVQAIRRKARRRPRMRCAGVAPAVQSRACERHPAP
jgi:hypothetical protein